MRTADVLQAFPVFALALVLVAVMGQGVASIVIALGVVNIPVYLRLMRGEALALRREAFVEAARVAGVSDGSLLGRHIIPNALAPILAQMTTNMGVAVLLTAGLSFLGAGVRAPTPEWGSMIAMGFQNVVTGQWWPSIFPGLALALTVFGFGRVGASIQAWSNPRSARDPRRVPGRHSAGTTPEAADATAQLSRQTAAVRDSAIVRHRRRCFLPAQADSPAIRRR